MNRCGAAWMRLRISKRPSKRRADEKQACTGPERVLQSIDPCALEADNGNAWYDAKTRTLHLIVGAQSPC